MRKLAINRIEMLTIRFRRLSNEIKFSFYFTKILNSILPKTLPGQPKSIHLFAWMPNHLNFNWTIIVRKVCSKWKKSIWIISGYILAQNSHSKLSDWLWQRQKNPSHFTISMCSKTKVQNNTNQKQKCSSIKKHSDISFVARFASVSHFNSSFYPS